MLLHNAENLQFLQVISYPWKVNRKEQNEEGGMKTIQFSYSANKSTQM